MRSPAASASLTYRYPVPYRMHWGYIWLWRVLSLAVLLWALGTTLWETRLVWGRREATLVGLVALQVACYLKTFQGNQTWPPPWRWRVSYGLGSALLWWLTWRLEARFAVMYWVYCGHLYVLMPPGLAIPAAALLLGLSVGQESGWDVSRLAWEQQMGRVLPWTVQAVLFSFMYHANHTRRERARLIAELQAAQRELEAARQRDAELAALQERERLARDLHDSPRHTLVTLSMHATGSRATALPG